MTGPPGETTHKKAETPCATPLTLGERYDNKPKSAPRHSASLATAASTNETNWKKLVEDCPRDDRFGFPMEDGPFLHFMLGKHDYKDSRIYHLTAKDLTEDTRINPRKVELNSEQRQQFDALLKAHLESYNEFRSEFLTSLDAAFHRAIDINSYVAIDLPDGVTPAAGGPIVKPHLERLRALYGRDGTDFFLMNSSLVRRGVEPDAALIYVIRSNAPDTFSLFDEMTNLRNSARATATDFFSRL